MAKRLVDGLIVRRGSRLVRNMTPREKDAEPGDGGTVGLSFRRQGRETAKGAVVDIARLEAPLAAFEDPKNPDHVLVSPVGDDGEIDMVKLREWASFRERTEIHPLTIALAKATVAPVEDES